MVDADAATVIRAQLLPEERLLWSGRPRQGVLWSWSQALPALIGVHLGLFGLIFLGVGLFAQPDGPPDLAFNVVFSLIGLGALVASGFMMWSALAGDARRRRRTFYGVTPERIVIVTGERRRRVRSYHLRTLTDLTLDESPAGWGTITFGPRDPFTPFGNSGARFPFIGALAGQRLEALDDAREVFRVVGEARRP